MRWFYRVLLKGIGGVVVITIDNVIGTAAPGLSEAARAFSTLLGSAVAKEIDQAMPTREPAHVGG